MFASNDFDSIKSDIVITGFSGRYPESKNVNEFRKNLYDNVDMVNDDQRRWRKGLYGLPGRTGKMKESNLTNFDLQFFGIHQKQAYCLDPQLRNALELTHEAIIDAGYNPQELRGSRTGVYFAVTTSEPEFYWSSNSQLVNGYGVTGCTLYKSHVCQSNLIFI